MKPTAAQVAAELKLQPHPEGGYFKEVYRSDEELASESLPARYNEAKRFSTSIYYLITADTFSAMHRLKSDETLHYYSGDTALVFMIHPDGRAEEILMGNNILHAERPQIVVPRQVWFGIKVVETGEYTLTGTTVAPGFEFSDFEMGKRESLIRQYPEHAEKIRLFTRQDSPGK